MKNKFLNGCTLMIVFAALACLPSAHAQAPDGEYPVLAKLQIDKMVYNAGDTMTIQFIVENQTDAVWAPEYPYNYVWSLTSLNPLGEVASGSLTFSEEQYVSSNSSTSFAIGTFELISAYYPPGLYRILLYGPRMTNTSNGDEVPTAASASFRIK